MNYHEFGKYLSSIRKRKSLTLNQVALYSEISAAQLSRIENGKRGVPKPATIKKLAEALKVDYEDLMIKADHISTEKIHGISSSLSEKDEKDIAKRMKKIREDLQNADGGLSFHGEPMSEEAMESLLEALEYAERTVTKINKKYIPKTKKYRKEND